MSTRQRSFFDKDTKQKKASWHPNRYASKYPPSDRNPDIPPQRTVVTGPPIMPSSHTRSKLKAFQFVAGGTDTKAQHPDKENMSIDSVSKQPPLLNSGGHDAVQNTSRTPKLGQSKLLPPSTPATRLPLADLVGNIDDSSRHVSKPDLSPQEQLYWRGSQPTTTPVHHRGTKRARSSSPIGPSQEEPRQASVRKEINTPQADPAVDLWNRYTSNKGTPSTKKGVAFTHLINESSPRSSATAGSVSGLRRWASCGTEFPGPTSKRQKTHGGFAGDEEADIFVAPSSDGNFPRNPEQSKLAGMLQRMRDTIAKPEPRAPFSNIPSSSSPLPEVGDRQPHLVSESPLRRHVRAQEADDEQASDSTMKAEGDAVEDTGKPCSSSDEFGDAEFDTEMVEALDISQGDIVQPIGDLSGNQLPGECETQTEQVEDATTINTIQTTKEPVSSDDEFGVDDDEVFAADLELVASLYDTRPVEESSGRRDADNTSLTKPAPPVIDLVDDDSDDFGDDGLDADELAAAEIAATQAYTSHHPSQQDARAIQRYLVKRVDESQYTSPRGHLLPEKVILVEDEKTKLLKAVTLRQAWYDTRCTPGSFVHVMGEFSPTGQIMIDDSQNMLILHPDHLLSATVVADSFGCMRRAVLQDRIKAASRANPPMLYGTLLHELFQEALKANRWDSEFLLDTVDKIMPSKFDTILEINSTCEAVKEHLSSKLPELQAWAEVFVRARPRPDAIVKQRNGKQSIMSINKLLDVEEHVWSPQYGLKGNIDATVQVVMHDDLGERVLTVPLEVKTGRNTSSTAHEAQTALYNLLLSNRYDVDVAYGILYYLETSEISRIPAVRSDIIHMVIKRNELACYVRDRIQLPPMLREDFKCQMCYAQSACFLYEKLVEDGEGQLLNKKAKEKYDEIVKYLKPTDQQFMKKWDMLLTKEESVMMKFRRELWTMLSTEREKLGRCFSNVVLEPGSASEDPDSSKINRYSYTFIKQKPKPGFSFMESQLIIGEPVVVSDEKGHFALANGYVTNVRKRRITVAVDRRLHNARTRLPGFNADTNQSFAGIMEVSNNGKPMEGPYDDGDPILYRLDKDEFSNGMAGPRNNLIQIMDDSVFKARPLRELIVDGRPPEFSQLPSASAYNNQPSQPSMNDDQKAAIDKVMSAKDYALVLGMPGTGKTTTIAHIIRALVAKGKSVLLTSYTHTAVDNILLKIRNDNIGILRLGGAAKIHPEVREFATIAAEPKYSLEELERTWMDPPVVATTCLTINHPLFNRRIFDYCIVDEASQITLPVCLGPIRMAQTFVLVGDHYQLPPLVQNKEAASEGLDISLFMLLCERHPSSVVSLEHQYRMCADVMLLSNTFIYSGRLKCGNSSVENRRLEIPDLQALQHHHLKPDSRLHSHISPCIGAQSPNCWLARALDPSSPVLFLNTDTISSSLETAVGSRINNITEARLILHLTLSFLSVGIKATDIGVIAFYRSQLALVRSTLQSAHTTTQSSDLPVPSSADTAAIELHTADKFQGRDKEVILVSCVRSNEAGVVGDLLKDRRRVNVAITRARSKLLIVGSAKTLGQNELLRGLVGLCGERGWVVDLAEADLDGHKFDEGASQPSSLTDGASRIDAAGREKGDGDTLVAPRTLGYPAKRPASASTSTSASPRKRNALQDITCSPPNAKMSQNPSPSSNSAPTATAKTRRTLVPKKVFGLGKRGVSALDANKPSVLRDVWYDAL